MRFFTALLLLLNMFSSALLAQSDLIDQSYHTEESPLQLRISAYKQNYTVNETIPVKITVKNISSEPRTITSLPEPSFSYDVNIFDSDRNLINRKESFNDYTRSSIKDFLKEERTVVLYPGEEFSVSIDLNVWYEITNMGRYLVQARFMDKEEGKAIPSNPLYINLKPSGRIIARLQIEEQLIEEERLTTMTPEGTVEFLMNAMKNQDWESYFKYIELPKFVKAYEPFAGQFDSASLEEEKNDVLTRFMAWYKNVPDYNKLERFKIQNIVFPADPRERIVYCYAGYSTKAKENDFLYTFFLRQKGNKWYLYDVESFISTGPEWGSFDRTQIKVRDDMRAAKKR